jgi:hypothetical protein
LDNGIDGGISVEFSLKRLALGERSMQRRLKIRSAVDVAVHACQIVLLR